MVRSGSLARNCPRQQGSAISERIASQRVNRLEDDDKLSEAEGAARSERSY